MSRWRQKAIECLPELRKDFEDPGTSIHDVFFELLPATVKFHNEHNNVRLQKIYDFAEWCFRQKSKDLWNAAGVAFYEHLGDHPETILHIEQWVKPDIYRDIRSLLELRISKTELEKLDKHFPPLE